MKVLSHEAESLRGDLHAHVSTRKDKLHEAGAPDSPGSAGLREKSNPWI